MTPNLRNTPELRQIGAALQVDDALYDMRKATWTPQAMDHRYHREITRNLADFLLRENAIKFREIKSSARSETTIIGTLWVVDDEAPGLDGRKLDIAAAELRGGAQAARDILNAAANGSVRVDAKPWQQIATEIVERGEPT